MFNLITGAAQTCKKLDQIIKPRIQNSSSKCPRCVHLWPMAKLHAPWSETMWTVFAQRCVLFLHCRFVCVFVCQSTNIYWGPIPCQPSRRWSATYWLNMCLLTTGALRRVTASFLLTMTKYLPSRVPGTRQVLNKHQLNEEWKAETQKEREKGPLCM